MPQPAKPRMRTWKKVLIGICGVYGAILLIAIVAALLADPGDSGTAVEQRTTSVDCTDIEEGRVMNMGNIPECVEVGEFDENSFSRVKVRASVEGHQLGKIFRLYDWDSEGRPINGSITVDHQETYETMIRLGKGDWVNLSCFYSSTSFVEDYSPEGNKAYAVVLLANCIDLK